MIQSINYDKNKYEICYVLKSYKLKTNNKLKKIIINDKLKISSNLKGISKFLNTKSKYVPIFDNNTTLVPNTLYDMIKLLQQHHLNSVSCLSNYSNYKDNLINNIYYHYKYLDHQSMIHLFLVK